MHGHAIGPDSAWPRMQALPALYRLSLDGWRNDWPAFPARLPH